MEEHSSRSVVNTVACEPGLDSSDTLHSDFVASHASMVYRTTKPEILGNKPVAIIVHHDTDNEIASDTRNDTLKLLQLASHPDIMRIPYEDVHPIPLSYVANGSAAEELAKISDQQWSFFLFCYTGHELVQDTDKSAC